MLLKNSSQNENQKVITWLSQVGDIIAPVLVMLFVLLSTNAQAATGFLKSKDTQAFTQVCYYDVLGDTHSLNIKSTDLCPLTYEFDTLPKLSKPAPSAKKTGFFKHDETSGFSRLCSYDVLGDTYVLTIGSTEICPLTYQF
ncbi:hypothetical protein VHA01S_037_00090 [Vibrio halioticoli NBRC 102217]|uniref:Uncharacterized protein n=1 Tax=Vibrio halioticoli NBRC 102217 TaxID=1219072 RepID=V5FKF5_9VIBR|nr:hypothetical protein [Vibrio halioticoli]GAD90221.1 hypothetical protein VHA01S_037_00090 [Vibrio halioticoli NBRC 102217]